MCKFKNIVMLALAATMLTSEVTFAAPGDESKIYTGAPAKRRDEAAVDLKTRGILATDAVREETELLKVEEPGLGAVVCSVVNTVCATDGVEASLLSALFHQRKLNTDLTGWQQELNAVEKAPKDRPAVETALLQVRAELKALPRNADEVVVRPLQEKERLLAAQYAHLTDLVVQYDARQERAKQNIKAIETHQKELTRKANAEISVVSASAGRAARNMAWDVLAMEKDEDALSVVQAAANAVARVGGYAGFVANTLQEQLLTTVQDAVHYVVSGWYDDLDQSDATKEIEEHARNAVSISSAKSVKELRELQDKAAEEAVQGKSHEQLIATLKQASFDKLMGASESIITKARAQFFEGAVVRAVLKASVLPTDEEQRAAVDAAVKRLSPSPEALEAFQERQDSVSTILGNYFRVERLAAVALEAIQGFSEDSNLQTEDLFASQSAASTSASTSTSTPVVTSTVAPVVASENFGRAGGVEHSFSRRF